MKALFKVICMGIVLGAAYFAATPLCFAGEEELYFMDIPPVVTASKKAEDIDKTPNTMYVITREEINRKGFKNIGDVLETLPGFGSQVSIRDLQFLAQVRGIASADNELITIMINGHKIDMFAEPGLLYGPINLENVDRIEVIIGPGSVLYGADTLGAIVNLIIEDVKKDVIASAGTANYSSLTINGGSKTDNGSVIVSASEMQRGGWNAYNNGSRLEGRVGQEYPSGFLFGRANVNDWSYQASAYNDSKPELNIWNGGSSATGPGNQGNFTNKMNSFVASNKSQWSDIVATTLDITYDDQRFSRLVTYVSDPTKTEQTYLMSQQKTGVEGALQISVGRNYFQAGAKYTVAQNPDCFLEYWNPQQPLVPAAIQLLVNDQSPIQTYGFYVSDDYKATDKLKIVAACRADYSTIFQNDHKYYFSPRLAIVDDVSSSWTSKLTYNKATRYPSPWNTALNPFYGVGNPLAVANPTNYGWTAFNYLVDKPETLSAVEFQNIFRMGESRIAINLYYQKLQDYYTWAFPWTNVGDFEGTGAELDVKGQINPKFGYTLGAATSHNNFNTSPSWQPPSWAASGSSPFLTAPNGDMMGVPVFSGSAGVGYRHNDNITVDLTLRYFTDQATTDAQAFPNTVGNYGYYKDVNYLDAGFQWKNFVERGLALRLFGKNLLDNIFKVAKDFDGGYYIPRGAFYGMSLDYAWGS